MIKEYLSAINETGKKTKTTKGSFSEIPITGNTETKNKTKSLKNIRVIKVKSKNSEIKDPKTNITNHLTNKVNIFSVKESLMNKSVFIINVNWLKISK